MGPSVPTALPQHHTERSRSSAHETICPVATSTTSGSPSTRVGGAGVATSPPTSPSELSPQQKMAPSTIAHACCHDIESVRHIPPAATPPSRGAGPPPSRAASRSVSSPVFAPHPATTATQTTSANPTRRSHAGRRIALLYTQDIRERSCGLDSPYGTLDLQPQRHPGRLRRPPRGNRRRRDARLLHPPHGRGRGDAVGPRHLRDDGELLAGGRPRRREGAAGAARVGGQAGGQAEVRGVVDAKGLPVDQQPPHRRRPAYGRAEAQGRDPGRRAPR